MSANGAKIMVNDLSIRFMMSYDRDWTLAERLLGMIRRRGQKGGPAYFDALSGVDLVVGEGDIVGVVGPNGCGKTTLLRAMSGIYHPDAGCVRRNGRVSTLLSLGTGFDLTLNGVDNIRLNGLLMGMSRSEVASRLPQILEFADIGDHIYEPMKTYSNGMISRISFSIVLAMEPDILLIDEVLSVGDLEFQRRSERVLQELLSRANCQVLVTHDLDFVSRHCNRAVYMQHGRIVLDGTTEEVVERYRSDVGEDGRAVSEDKSAE